MRRVTSGDKTIILHGGVDGFTEETEHGKRSTKRQATLTPDNAHDVFTKCFNLEAFLQSIGNHPITSETLLQSLKDCVIESEVVSFSNVTVRHLKELGIEQDDVELHGTAIAAANHPESASNKSIQRGYLDSFRYHFNVTKESGCRSLIDQYVFYAMVYAQNIIDNDDSVRSLLAARYNLKQLHVAVFAELSIPSTRITYEPTNVTYAFHGLLDYGLCFIKSRDKEMLAEGILGVDPSKVLCSILVAKTEAEMQFGDPQIIAQLLSILQLSERPCFTGALTNGALWRFFVARIVDSELRVSGTATFKTDGHSGLIIELLKDMIIHEISPIFSFV